MKKIVLLSVLLVTAFSFSQNKHHDDDEPENNKTFRFNNKGLTPNDITTYISGGKYKTMHAKAKAWVKEKYGENHKKLEETDDDNNAEAKGSKVKKLRLNAFSNNAICFDEDAKFQCVKAEYVIELQFSDGEYKFKPKKLFYNPPSSKKRVRIHFNKSIFHESTGKLSRDHKKVPAQIENLFNNLNRSLYNYLTDRKQEDEW